MYSKLFLHMKQNGTTQKEVARLINVSDAALSNKLYGTSDFTVSEARLLCQGLNIGPEIFFEETEKNEGEPYE